MKADSKTDISRRANQGDAHNAQGAEVTVSLHQLGWDIVRREYLCSDAVAIGLTHKSPFILAVENEFSARNVLRNMERNFRQGAAIVLIVCPDADTLAAVARKVARHAPNAAQIAFATPLTLRLLQPQSISEPNPSEKPEEPS
jgi:hypothetical protein